MSLGQGHPEGGAKSHPTHERYSCQVPESVGEVQTWRHEWEHRPAVGREQVNLEGRDGTRALLARPSIIWRARFKACIWRWSRDDSGGLWSERTPSSATNTISQMLEDLSPVGTGNRICVEGFRFMPDNRLVHVARSTMSLLQQQNTNVLRWPPCSTDLNPMESLWRAGWLGTFRKWDDDPKTYESLNP